MGKDELNQLITLLKKLQSLQLCKGKYCDSLQSCEYGINGCYGDICAIEYVLDAIRYDENLKSR